MKEAIVSKGPSVKIVDSDIPKPQAKQVVIKVHVSGSNPKDWKIPEWRDQVANSGDDIAGVVHAVGKDVYQFKPGDRVAAFHEMMTSGGSYAEYAVAWDHTTFHLPESLSYEEAATLPLAALTAAVGLYEKRNLALPEPWAPAEEEIPLVVYGGASAVGAYAIQLAKKSNIHPIIAVAGKGIPFVEKLLDKSKGDAVIDYREGDEAVISGIRKALNRKKLFHAYDAISEHNSYVNLGRVLESKGRLGLVLPFAKPEDIPEYVQRCQISVGDVHKDEYKDFGFVHWQNIARGLVEGWFKPHPYEVIPGGLDGVQQGLQNLKDGKASAVKYVFKIAS